ncbi:hypothetical protein C1H46_037905 [Malus baccata]|uniref:Uncharacterized protein n=1 Tax=Malus baccata TaxID=106549 RepID=A0A540KQU4_MALBA|nr:hypothetical protein C1H46_037905 [Malus baccata]
MKDYPYAICGWISTPLGYPDRGVKLNSMADGHFAWPQSQVGQISTSAGGLVASLGLQDDVLWNAKMVQPVSPSLEPLAGGRTT